MSEVYKALAPADGKLRRAISDPKLGSAILESIGNNQSDVDETPAQLRRALRLARLLTRNIVEELETVDPEFRERRRTHQNGEETVD